MSVTFIVVSVVKPRLERPEQFAKTYERFVAFAQDKPERFMLVRYLQPLNMCEKFVTTGVLKYVKFVRVESFEQSLNKLSTVVTFGFVQPLPNFMVDKAEQDLNNEDMFVTFAVFMLVPSKVVSAVMLANKLLLFAGSFTVPAMKTIMFPLL